MQTLKTSWSISEQDLLEHIHQKFKSQLKNQSNMKVELYVTSFFSLKNLEMNC